MDEETMIELQSCILGLSITDLKAFGSEMKWLKFEEVQGKARFELIKIIRTAMEDEASKCEGDEFGNFVEKIKTILDKQTSEKNKESSEEAEKKKQELQELEIQYEQLSKEQEELKKKMELLEDIQKQSNPLKNITIVPEVKTSSEAGLTDLKASIFRREFKIQGQIGEPGQKDKLTYQSLISQIDAGLNKGYAKKEVVTAVIRSIETID